jgi:hypothetical protein
VQQQRCRAGLGLLARFIVAVFSSRVVPRKRGAGTSLHMTLPINFALSGLCQTMRDGPWVSQLVPHISLALATDDQ